MVIPISEKRNVYFVNPSDASFGIGVMPPRWQYVLGGATPREHWDPVVLDETLEPFKVSRLKPNSVVAVGIHTQNALAGYEVGSLARAHGHTVVFGGVHASLYPDEARDLGGAHTVVTGDGDVVWPQVLADCRNGGLKPKYIGGRVAGDSFQKADWGLMPKNRYMWGSVQTVKGCPKNCSFCSVWISDGQEARASRILSVIEEIVELRRMGIRFVVLADDNAIPVTLADLVIADRRVDKTSLNELLEIRADRFRLFEALSRLPSDMVFFTQITMEVADDPKYLVALRRANIRGALIGIEAVTEAGLKSVYKKFNAHGEELVEKLRTIRASGLHILGSFITGLESDNLGTFDETLRLALASGIDFAQFIPLSMHPGTVDFRRWEQTLEAKQIVEGQPLSRFWLVESGSRRPKACRVHPDPEMSRKVIRERTLGMWSEFHSLRNSWRLAGRIVTSLRWRFALVGIYRLYYAMFAKTGLATDSARKKTNRRARWLARLAFRMFRVKPMTDLQVPQIPEAPEVPVLVAADASLVSIASSGD